MTADEDKAERRARIVYLAIWTAMATPLLIDLWVGYGPVGHNNGSREWMNVDLGVWGLRLFLVSLMITPAATLLRQPAIARYRRVVSLFAFAYVAIHSLDYVFYAHAWAFPARVWGRRPYLLFGIVATLLMIPLAVTSFDRARARMGFRGWKKLHAVVYAVTPLVIVHTLWEELNNWIEPAMYCALLAVLLAIRLPPVMAALKGLQVSSKAKAAGQPAS